MKKNDYGVKLCFLYLSEKTIIPKDVEKYIFDKLKDNPIVEYLLFVFCAIFMKIHQALTKVLFQ